ncbi:PEGA domain-containing protein, partial [Salinispira pacifica]
MAESAVIIRGCSMLRRFDQGAQFRARTSACPLGSVVLAVFLLLVSCASVPSPGTPSDALLITVVDGPVQGAAVPVVSESYIIEGPEQLRNTVSHREWNYHTDRVPAGTYRLVSRRLELADGSTRTLSYDPAPEVAVGPSSIVLLPWKLGARVAPEDGADESSAVGLYAPTPEDQRRAAEDLSDLIATFSWAGRRTYGFGPFSPFGNLGKESYRLEVATQPADARLSIDRQVWGRTPIVADLSPGRHFLLIERAGYEPYRSFVDLQADGRENFVLKKAAASVDASQAKMTALLEPFTNLGGENEAYLSEIFASSLEVTLGRDGLDIRR